MLILALDTAGPNCAVALGRATGKGEPAIVAVREERLGRGHAERLMPMIEEVLAEAGMAFADLDRMAVTTGPGSFTGVRVGVAAARALALALDIPAVGVGSLAALAEPVRRTRGPGTVVAALDARRGEIFVAAGIFGSGETLLEPRSVTPAAAAQLLAAAPDPLILIGAGAPLLAEALGGRQFEIAGTAEYPDIVDVVRLGLKSDTGRHPVPLYARGADAKPQSDKAIARL
jgi:tRNA threonylcarbamoyladenosine biosynthesis protein TsaB